MKEIEQTLTFLVEIEKLKDIHRKTKPVGLDRYENSAEHSWHVCISALMLKDYANEQIDINHVIKMLLIHDLGEIDAGDTIIYSSETSEVKQEEEEGVKRVLGILPKEKQDEYLNLWYEFEAGESAESKFARAIDRIPPIFHNLHDNGGTWQRHNVPKEKVFEVNSRIEKGSKDIWEVIKTKLDGAIEDGLLK